jgi:carbonic anhydrase/acetyltransferase-like protein (isoleucine patch superfamily)
MTPPPNSPNFDAVAKGLVTIGHDVWIGESAIILSGSTIGTGAVIGAGAVVSGIVPPYAIVVGNRAQVIRMRFSEHIVDQLLASRWWELPDSEISALNDAFYQKDISLFLDRVKDAWERLSPEIEK